MAKRLKWDADGNYVGIGGNESVDEGGLESMTVAELRDYADANSVDLGDATKKADIIAALKA